MKDRSPKIILFKFGLKSHMEDFRKGILYMNELEYFNKIEKDCILRGDMDEGLSAVYQGDGAKIYRQNNMGHYEHIGTGTGLIKHRESYSINHNIFCMYALKIQPIKQSVDKRNLKFGDSFVFISDPSEFLNRVKSVAEKKGVKVFHKLVGYVDRKKHNGSVGPFCKFSEFSYQNEFRILVCQESRGPYKFDIGDISNITEQGELNAENLNLFLCRF